MNININISIQHLTDKVHVQWCRTPGCQVAVATEFSTVATNICTYSAFNFLLVTLLVPTILMCNQYFLENTSMWTSTHVYPLEQSHVQHRRHASQSDMRKESVGHVSVLDTPTQLHVKTKITASYEQQRNSHSSQVRHRLNWQILYPQTKLFLPSLKFVTSVATHNVMFTRNIHF
jgi:hypothetical protein